jgi:hypothetical protein
VPANQQKATIQQLKKRALELAELPRNRGWFELSQVLDLLSNHRGKKGSDQFQNLIRDGVLGRRSAYYLRDVGHLIWRAKVPTSKAERIGWTKLQIIGDKVNARNITRLLKLAEQNNAQELKRLIKRDHAKPKPHCVQLYFTAEQYLRYVQALTKHGARRSGRGLVGKEAAIMRIVREAS